MDFSPEVYEIKGGWAARGNGWAVHAKTKEEALRKYREAAEEHAWLSERPIPVLVES